MKEKVVKVDFSNTFEPTPIAMFVQLANNYESSIHIIDGTKKFNAKSIMGLMSINFGKQKEVTVSAEGEDENEAIEALSSYFENIK